MARPISSDLAAFLVDWRAASWPIEWEAVFGREAPLALEIGFGNGQFIAERALLHPERNHIGLELSWSAATRLFKRLDPSRTPFVRAALADAEVALERFFSTDSLAEVFVNHPCPWPKKRHQDRRLLDSEGLALLADRMQVGAILTVVTDHADYAAWLAQVLQSQDALVSCHARVEAPEPNDRRPTKYQLRAMAQGVAIHYFEWKKARGPRSAPPAASNLRGPMPSLTLRGSYDERTLFAGFRPQILHETQAGVEVVVRLLEVYERRDRGGWLVEALVLEDRLRQAFAIRVVARGLTELLIKLSELGYPHPTYGAKRAVACVGHWLLAHNPELTIVHQTVGEEALIPPELRAESE